MPREARAAAATAARAGGPNIVKVQSAVNASLARDLPQTLGGDFLTGLRFTLVPAR
ncbi:hypothetical protein [Nonomuraea sp. NPDC048916]|uniref:hypothetical protein n=1 Tax=Nonomuraea sp. NPDC048916 TaxID=3154232 RepID=UPI0033D7AD4E